jgi:hypothetical protein
MRAALPPAKADELLPVTAESFTAYFETNYKQARKLQRKLIKSIQEERFAQFKASIAGNKREMARQHCITAQGATLASTTYPTTKYLELTHEGLQFLERMSLGLGPVPDMPLHCACNRPNGSFCFDKLHGLACIEERGTSRSWEHHDLKYCVARWLTRLGATVIVERTEYDNRNNKKRPDLRAEIGGKVYLIDVTIRHALSPSYIDKNISPQGPLNVAKAAEVEKIRENRVIADHEKATFVPFAVETTGGMGPAALKFIQEMIAFAAKIKNVWVPREVVHGIYRSVAVAVANGNAVVMRRNLDRAERRGVA